MDERADYFFTELRERQSKSLIPKSTQEERRAAMEQVLAYVRFCFSAAAPRGTLLQTQSKDEH